MTIRYRIAIVVAALTIGIAADVGAALPDAPEVPYGKEANVRNALRVEARGWIAELRQWREDYRRAATTLDRPQLRDAAEARLNAHEARVLAQLGFLHELDRDLPPLLKDQDRLRDVHARLAKAHANLLALLERSRSHRRRPEIGEDRPQ